MPSSLRVAVCTLLALVLAAASTGGARIDQTPPKPAASQVAQPVAERLHRDGVTFKRADGTVFKWHGITAFTALQDWIEGRQAKLESYADRTQALGVNVWRVLGMWSVTGFDARRDGYLAGLRAFLEWSRARGLYVQFTLFADQVDGSPVRLTTEEQDRLLRDVLAICRDAGNVFFEVSNEDWKNGQLAARFPRSLFDGVLAARSAPAEDQFPDGPGPLLDFTVHHTPRDPGWMRQANDLVEVARLGWKDAKSGRVWQPTGLPAVATEPIRILEGTTAREHADYLAIADLLGAGGNIHGGNRSSDAAHQTNLQRCEYPASGSQLDREARQTLDAVSAVWRAGIPLDANAGQFTRGGQPDAPLAHDPAVVMRTFCMIQGAQATCVIVQSRTGYTAVAINGWQVVRRTGYEGNVVLLRRPAAARPLESSELLRNGP